MCRAMTARQRAVLLGLAAVVLVVAVVVAVSSGGGDDSGTAGTTATTAAAPAAGAVTTPTERAPAAPATPTVELRDGRPVGGLEKVSVRKGDTIRLTVASEDTSGEIHLHGYDVKRDLEAGSSVTFAVPATIEGIFEVELESSATQIAQVTVEP